MAEKGSCLGILALSDVLRPEAGSIVKKLTGMNTGIVLLTGDNKKTADYFAKQVGISAICAELLPEHKVEHIINFRKKERRSAWEVILQWKLQILH